MYYFFVQWNFSYHEEKKYTCDSPLTGLTYGVDKPLHLWLSYSLC